MLTDEAKKEVLDTLNKLDERFKRNRFANEYESGQEDGFDRLLESVKDELLLHTCVDCGQYLERDQITFCTEHRDLFEQAKKQSQY